MSATRGQSVAAALLLDALFGEPPEALHPVVWMGRAISTFERRALMLKSPESRRTTGIVLALALPVSVYLISKTMLAAVPERLRWVVEAAMISTTVSMRGLASAAQPVERELRAGDLEAARTRVGEFVGRDTEALPESEVARAAVESVAENTSDGVVAPILYAFVLGAPGALTYKAVNTLDSMVGYRSEPHTHLGCASARLDDLTNLPASRLTVLAITCVSGPVALRTAYRYGKLTSSPNAGWVEAAFSGALGLRLGGTNSYGGELREGPVLGDGRPPSRADIPRAISLMRRCCVLLALVFLFGGRMIRGG